MLDYFESKVPQPEETLPNWVSKSNSSYTAYKELVQSRTEKWEYIKSCTKIKELARTKSYKIIGTKIAKSSGIAASTLLATSSYSKGFSQLLEQFNSELLYYKEQRVNRIKAQKSKGPIARNKDELVDEVKRLKAQNKKLKELNIETQIKTITSNLHLDIRRKLFGE